MQSPSRPTDRKGSRLQGVDQARAVAIIAMMVFHFAPGVFKQLPQLKSLETAVLLFGRMATPAFVVVFGATAGLVFLPRYVQGAAADTTRRLRRRALWIFLFAIIITVPVWVRLAAHGVTDVWEWVFGAYSVLLFYTVALALLPVWFQWLAPRPERRAAISGVALWAAGTAGYYLWPQRPLSAPEFVRMILVSGNYGYVQMMGTAILAMPIGLHLRRAHDAGHDRRFLRRLLVAGLALSAIGITWGVAAGEYDMHRIVAGKLSVPPRPWYFLHFGSLALAAIAGFDLLTRRVAWLSRPGYVLALFGQASLLIFTAHTFVLPTLELFDHVIPLHGIVRVAMAFIPFMLFCALVIYLRHRQPKRQAAPRPAVEVDLAKNCLVPQRPAEPEAQPRAVPFAFVSGPADR